MIPSNWKIISLTDLKGSITMKQIKIVNYKTKALYYDRPHHIALARVRHRATVLLALACAAAVESGRLGVVVGN